MVTQGCSVLSTGDQVSTFPDVESELFLITLVCVVRRKLLFIKSCVGGCRETAVWVGAGKPL